jgi:hypothetical protein
MAFDCAVVADYHTWMPSSSNAIPAIQVPTGGQLFGFTDAHSFSSECSSVTNLQTQVAPLLVSMSCQLKILKLLKPLIEVIRGLPNPPLQALLEFSKVATELEPCLLVPSAPAILPFVRDLLCIELRSLRCLLRNLQAVGTQAGADSGSSTQLLARSILDSYVPVVGVLKLAAEFFQLAGIALPAEPILSGGTDPASLHADQAAIVAYTAKIQEVADAIGGCP